MPASEAVVLVTGATGILGANLVRLLVRRGYRVRALARNTKALKDCFEARATEFLDGDLRDPNVRRAAVRNVTTIFHACHSHRYWERNRVTYEINVEASLALLKERGLDRSSRIIFSNSLSTLDAPPVVYDEELAERIPRRQFNSLTKYWAEIAIDEYASESGLDVAHVHCPYLVGRLDFNPTPLRLLTPLSSCIPIPIAPAGGCSVVDAEEAAEKHLEVAEKLDLKEGDRRRLVVPGINVMFREYIEILNRAAGHDLNPVEVPAEIFHAVAKGKVFDSWCARRMSEIRFGPEGKSACVQRQLEGLVLKTMGWFREHSPLVSLPALVTYARRFF